MSWHRLVLSSVLLSAAAGCAGGPSVQAAGVPRLQKPENETPPESPPGLPPVTNQDLPAFAVGKVTSSIRASVNGAAILDSEVREAVYPLLVEAQSLPEPERSVRQKEIYEREMQRLIEREIVLQEALTLLGKRPQVRDKLRQAAGKEFDKQIRSIKTRYSISSDEDLKAALRGQGMTLEGIRRQIERNFMSREYLNSRIFPVVERITHGEILEYYENHPAEFEVTDSVKWLDIFIDAGRFPDRALARQFAEDIATRARAGEDFHQLAVKYDNGDSSYRNGEGFGSRQGEIKPADLEPVLFSLQEGQIGPVTQVGNGYHIFKVAKRQYAGRMPFDEKVQSAIRNKLTGIIWEREQKRVLAELKRKAAVEIYTAVP